MNAALSTQAGAMPDRVVLINGEPFLFFSGTAYLCMNRNQRFTRLIEEGMQLYGSNYGSSRTGNFKIPVYETAEQALAQQLGAESALTVSSGFMAAQLVIRYFETRGTFLYAPDSHPAILRNSKDYYIGDFADWKKQVLARVEAEPEEQFILVGNSIDPLKLQAYDFSWLYQLRSNKQVILVLDDSHGLGITGDDGKGIYQQLAEYSQIEPIVVSSLAKAMGMPGGIILAREPQLAAFRKSTFYTAASPMAPAYLHAYLQADEIYKTERENLQRNIRYFSDKLDSSTGIRFRKDYPVFACPDAHLAQYLYERKILISCFSYPNPTDAILTRIIINSHHTAIDLDNLAYAIHSFELK